MSVIVTCLPYLLPPSGPLWSVARKADTAGLFIANAQTTGSLVSIELAGAGAIAQPSLCAYVPTWMPYTGPAYALITHLIGADLVHLVPGGDNGLEILFGAVEYTFPAMHVIAERLACCYFAAMDWIQLAEDRRVEFERIQLERSQQS